MGSKTYSGVWFTSYSRDHPPPHVHAQIAGVEVVIDLLQDGRVRQSMRTRAVKPIDAKRGDVRRILAVAAAHEKELRALWEKTHG